MTRLLAWLALAASVPLHAADFPSIGSVAQSQFRAISEDLGAAFAYKGVTPATALKLSALCTISSLASSLPATRTRLDSTVPV